MENTKNTILASVYALNPYKGSEDGMGWNFVSQIALHNNVLAVTRENNRPQIEKYMEENPQSIYSNIEFLYYDLPYFLRFWKKGSRGAMPYYYLWQLFLPLFILSKKIKFDIVHNLNFHNDWTPSMLWTLGKPMLWGPVGHHPKIPKEYILPVYGFKSYLKDRLTWILKLLFWNIDPLLKLTKWNAAHILGMNSSIQKALKLKATKWSIMPSVASEDVPYVQQQKKGFNILSVGRFVPLKGFDITIKSFAQFYHDLEEDTKKETTLTLVGSGPEKEFLMNLCAHLNIKKAVTFIEWIERDKLQDIYREASIFLFPSHEGAGMVVSEALSHGLPVLCFDNVGPGEFITNNCGIKVPYTAYEKSISLFASHLLYLFDNKNMLEKLSINARERYENTFAWNIRGEKLKEIYTTLNLAKQNKLSGIKNLNINSISLN